MVEEAREQEDAVEPPEHAHARLRKGDKLKSLAALLTAGTALLAALGAFLKTFDHGVTESAYNTLSESIVKLSDQQRRTQEDVAMLRGYLDGLSHAPLAATGSGAAPPPPIVDAGAPHPPPSATTTITFNIVDAGHARVPVVAPPAPPVKPPPFAAAISK